MMLLKPLKSAYLGFWTTFIAIVMIVILCGLGTWQVKRLQWKENLLSTIEQQLKNDPTPLPNKIEGDWSFRPVVMTGKYRPQNVFYIEPRTQNGVMGYHRFIAFDRDHGDTVFVNTGWVQEKGVSDIQLTSVDIVGYVRIPDQGSFTPNNDISKNTWYWPDITAMAEYADIQNISSVLVYLEKPDPASIRNNHLQYAIFWFGMAFLVIIFYILMGRGKYKEQDK